MPVLDQDSSLGVKYSSALRRIGLFNARPAPVNMPLWQRANGQNPDRATSTSAGTVTVILDSERRIRFFAQATSSIFNFIGADIGRPIFEMLSLTGDDKLITETMAALDGPVPHRCEITGMDGRVYDFSITAGEVPGTDETGFILSYTDVSGILAVGDRFEEAMSYAESIIEAIPQLFVILDRSLMIVSASKSFYDCFHLTEDEVIGEKITDIDGGRLDVISLRDFYDGLRGREANLGGRERCDRETRGGDLLSDVQCDGASGDGRTGRADTADDSGIGIAFGSVGSQTTWRFRRVAGAAVSSRCGSRPASAAADAFPRSGDVEREVRTRCRRRQSRGPA